MLHGELCRNIQVLNDAIMNISTDALFGSGRDELLKHIPRIQYPEPVYHWLIATAAFIKIGDSGVHLVNGQWQFIQPIKDPA